MAIPYGHWKTTTFVAGLRKRGMVAPFVLDGPINRYAFEVYVEQVLVPDLRPGDIVIMDNLSSHKGPASALIEAAGANLLYLPPYSPDFNPIENAFAKLKALPARPPSAPSKRSGPPSPSRRNLHPRRVRQLLPRGRLRSRLIGFRSSQRLRSGHYAVANASSSSVAASISGIAAISAATCRALAWISLSTRTRSIAFRSVAVSVSKTAMPAPEA